MATWKLGRTFTFGLLSLLMACGRAPAPAPPVSANAPTDVKGRGPYAFVNAYPPPETVQRAYDDGDYARAIQAYKRLVPVLSDLRPGGVRIRWNVDARRLRGSALTILDVRESVDENCVNAMWCASARASGIAFEKASAVAAHY